MELIRPDWPAPRRVRALATTRSGGVSRGVYASLNLGSHVGDDPQSVRENRARLGEALRLPRAPLWLKQVHGTTVVDAAETEPDVEADGSFTSERDVVCAVLTADCLPIFLCDRAGTKVALVHAGWRGLAGGVVESGLGAFGLPGADLLAWLGPGIGAQAYEVGDDVRHAFVRADAGDAEAFTPNPAGRWWADMYRLARRRLERAGVKAIYGGDYCTATQKEMFFSYRRDATTGRMASLIWLE